MLLEGTIRTGIPPGQFDQVKGPQPFNIGFGLDVVDRGGRMASKSLRLSPGSKPHGSENACSSAGIDSLRIGWVVSLVGHARDFLASVGGAKAGCRLGQVIEGQVGNRMARVFGVIAISRLRTVATKQLE